MDGGKPATMARPPAAAAATATTKPEARSSSVVESQSLSAWQEVSRLGLIEAYEHDSRPSVIVDLHAVDVARGEWGRVYTNAAYEATPSSETWTKFERRDGRRVYSGPPDYMDWAYGYAPSPDPVPMVWSDTWAVSRATLRSRWRILSATRRDPPERDHEVIVPSVKPIPIPEAKEDLAAAQLAGSSSSGGGAPQSWSRESDMSRSASGAKSLFANLVYNISTHPMLKVVDWSLSSLGAPDVWPCWMKQIISMVLVDMDPVIVVWKDRTVIYNELVVPLIAQKHPMAQGSDAAVSFAELWSFLEPMIETVYKTKRPKRIEAMPLPMMRHGYLEETFWTFTLIPIFNEEGEVEGVLDRFNEMTTSMIGARRLEQVTQISEKTSEATNLSDLWSKVIEVMEYHASDTPFALLYSIENTLGQIPTYSKETVREGQFNCSLRCHVGLEGRTGPFFERFNLNNPDHSLATLAAQAFQEGKSIVARSLDGSLPAEFSFGVQARGFGDTVNAVAAIPIMPAPGKAVGVLFIALNPRRKVDTDYYAFMRLLMRKLNEAFASVFLPLEERKYRAEIEKAAMDQANLAKQLLLRTMEAEHNAAAFSRLAANAPLGMFMFSSDGHPLYVNDYYFELTGLSRVNFGKLSWMEGVHPDERDRLMDFWHQLYHQKMPVSFEFRMNKSYITTDQDGMRVEAESWGLVSSFPQLDEEGEIINVIGWQIDISPQKWAATVQKERLKDALESRTQAHRFIDMVSHECRNPLSAILQSADGILTTIATIPDLSRVELDVLKDAVEAIADSAQTVVLCAQHQKRIVDDILTVSKLDGNHLIITPDKADPVALVDHVLKMYDAEFDAVSIKSEVIVMDGYRTLGVDFVLLDPSRVLQILINLVTNAIKFTARQKKQRKITVLIDASVKRPFEGLNGGRLIPQRSAKLSPTATHPEWANGKDLHVQFAVMDTGRGMSPEEMDKLFERFAQASPRTHVKYGGSGLGLFISRELTELQGGQVSVSSSIGLGSTFSFFINARRSSDPSKNSQTPLYTPGPASNGSGDNGHPHSPAYPFPHIPSSGSSSASSSLPMAGPTSIPTSIILGSKSGTPTLRDPSSQTTPGRQPASPAPPPPLSSDLHVLVVEDNLINQKVMAKQLQRVGCTVHVANHGVEALDFLRRSEFSVFPPCVCGDEARLDVILMDIEMPVMDGVSCVKEIRAMQRRGDIHSRVPVIAVTANARDAQQAEARDVGMDTVVTKPFRIPELVPKMQDLVERIKARNR